MPRFAYESRDANGRASDGVIQAGSMEDAGALLRRDGKFIIKLKAVADFDPRDVTLTLDEHARRVKRQDVIFFAHQLAVMIETGVPLSDALECCAEQAANPSFGAVVQDVLSIVQSGGQLSVALRRHERVFPGVMISLLAASEASGTMGAMLERISKYLAKQQQITRQVRGAMMYPMIMMAAAMGVTVFLLAFVLPRFAAIYSNRGATLPLPTRMLMGISTGLSEHWMLWLTTGGIVSVLAIMALGSEQGRRGIDWLKLHTPVLGNLFNNLYLTRSTSTIGTMLSAGVPIIEAVNLARETTTNSYYRELWDQVEDTVSHGQQVSDAIFSSPIVPRSVAQMIRSGERAGRLGPVLMRVAEFTEEEFDQSVKNTTQFIEPVMIAVMGAMIGFVAISLLLPIFNAGHVVSG